MENRAPTPGQEGRVYIVPENGGTPFYARITMADGATVLGTPWAKETVLQDNTAALYGLDSSAVPDAVLALLGRFNSGLGNEYVWEKYVLSYSFTLDGVSYSYYETLSYSSEVTVVNGEYTLVNPTSITLNSGSPNVLAGMYFQPQNNQYTYYTADGNSGQNIGAQQITGYTEEKSDFSFVNSPDSDAYPPAVSDGYTYQLLGQIGGAARVKVGSYVGTGTYGSSNAIEIPISDSSTFALVWKEMEVYNDSAYAGLFFPGMKKYILIGSSENYSNNGFSRNYRSTWAAPKLTFYANNADSQLNFNGATYHYAVFNS